MENTSAFPNAVQPLTTSTRKHADVIAPTHGLNAHVNKLSTQGHVSVNVLIDLNIVPTTRCLIVTTASVSALKL